ncbi:MAG: hypothetical protein DYG98_27180 [Haliscomenobacteraceae bacterium CHB4]|nr:hypothetical protein [Haliscomenobacteraceae bacterium CHB4]
MDIFFIDSTLGWLVTYTKGIFKTIDGGVTWFKVFDTDSVLWGLFFLNSETGWAVGSNSNTTEARIFKTIDGGALWNQQNINSSERIEGIFFTDSLNGFVTAGCDDYFKTTDGGDSWTNYNGNSCYDYLFFLNNQVGWISGITGLLKTTDGGNSFTSISYNTTFQPGRFVFVSENEGWYVDFYGSIKHLFLDIPDCVLQTHPVQGSVNVPIDTSISWNPANGCPDGYRLTLSTTPGGSDLLNNVDVGNTTTYQPVQPLPINDTVYVYVTAYNELGSAAGCQEYWFVTAGEPCTTTVTNVNDDGPGSLRAAIQCANTRPGPDTIRFNIPGAGPHLIALTSSLPGFSDPKTVLDGTTQPGNYPMAGKIIVDCPDGSAGIINGADSCEIYGIEFRKTNMTPGFYNTFLFFWDNTSNYIIGAENKGNYFVGTNVGIGFKAGNKNNRIRYNTFGESYDKTQVGIASGVDLQWGSNNNIIEHNTISNYSLWAIQGIASFQNKYSQNKIYCNEGYWPVIHFENANNYNPSPQINVAGAAQITGTSSPGDYIEVFINDTSNCGPMVCQGRVFLGSAIADPTGQWKLAAPYLAALNPGDMVTATATDAFNNTSVFADCMPVILPCNFTVNLGPDIVACAGSSLLLDAGPGDIFHWNNSETNSTISVNAPGWYSVTVTDNNGCTATDSVQITVNQLPALTATTTLSTCNQSNGSINLHPAGAAPFTFNWADLPGPNEPEDRNNLPPGQYLVTITDANGCSAASTVTVGTDNSTPTANISAIPAAAHLTCINTSVQLTAIGGGTYQWSNGPGNTATVNVSTPGTYQVTVTGGNGCTSVATQIVTQNINLPVADITPTATELTCTVVSITLTAGGGGAYQWSGNLGTSNTVIVNSPGVYTVTVTDPVNGCTAQTSVAITQNAQVPVVTLTAAPSNTLDCNHPTITLSATGGGTYLWSNGLGTGATAIVGAPGNYTVTVTLPNGCSNAESIAVIQDITPPVPVISMDPPGGLDCGSGTVTLTVNGLSQAYQWSGGQNTPGITVSAAGTYNVTVTGANGCTGTAVQTVNPSAVVTLSRVEKLCPGGSIQIGGEVFDKNNLDGEVTIPGVGGDCDTVVNVSLSFYPDAASQSLDVVLCPNEMYDFNGQILSQAGLYRDTLFHDAGCDSMYIALKLSFKTIPPFAAEADSAVVTAGESVTVPVMDNDDTPPGGGVSIQVLTQPSQALATLSGATGIEIAVPDIHAVGYDSMQYILCHNECPAYCDTAPVFIRILPSCLTKAQAEIPTVITPNGDGLNDEFDPLEVFDTANCVQIGSKSSLVILNRWGEVVFRPGGYEKWDGPGFVRRGRDSNPRYPRRYV